MGDSNEWKLWGTTCEEFKKVCIFRNLAKMSRESVASATTSGISRSDTTGGSSSGGGGGGGKESNWLIDLEETFKNNKKVLERIKKLRAQNKGLNDEIIQSLAEDEEAYKDYMSGKYTPAEVSKMYFGNLKTDAKNETKEMRKQKRREDKIKNDSSITDPFVQDQLLADEKLMEGKCI